MDHRRQRGIEGEAKAVDYLRSRGWRIIKKNFRTRLGEVDIIGDDGRDIVFVEVKSWKTLDRSSLEYAINARKRSRIVRTADWFLAREGCYQSRTVRFDVVFVDAVTGEIDHLRDAFQASWDG